MSSPSTPSPAFRKIRPLGVAVVGDPATQAAHRPEMFEMADMEAGHAHHGDAKRVKSNSHATFLATTKLE